MENHTSEIVDLQLEFYNNHDLEGFCSTYTDDVEVYSHDKRVVKGKDQLRGNYRNPIENDKFIAKVKRSIVFNNKVVYLEEFGPEDNLIYECLAIYEIRDGLISKLSLYYYW